MKKMGRPSTDTEPVTVRLPKDMIEALDEARRNLPEIPSRQEVIRRILTDWQKSQG